VVLIGFAVARLVGSRRPFQQDAVVATACYAAGLHALVVGLLYFAIMLANALYSTEYGTAISRSLQDDLLTGAVALTALWGAIAVAVAIRIASQQRPLKSPLVHYPIGTATAALLLAVIYFTVEISFNVGAADSRRQARFERDYRNGFRVSVIDSQSELGPGLERSQMHLTLAVTNVSSDKILVPRHRKLITADKQRKIHVVGHSIDNEVDPAMILEPKQTRVVRLKLDMKPLHPKLLAGEMSERVLFPFRKAANGYSFNEAVHYLDVPLPDYGRPVIGRGINSSVPGFAR